MRVDQDLLMNILVVNEIANIADRVGTDIGQVFTIDEISEI
jgi:hypothetical protein